MLGPSSNIIHGGVTLFGMNLPYAQAIATVDAELNGFNHSIYTLPYGHAISINGS